MGDEKREVGRRREKHSEHDVYLSSLIPHLSSPLGQQPSPNPLPGWRGDSIGPSIEHLMPTHRRLTVCREGWCYAVVLALIFGGALVRGVNLLVVLAGLLAGPLLLSRFMATFNLKGLLVRRKVPKGVCAGELLFPASRLAPPPPRGKLGRGRRRADRARGGIAGGPSGAGKTPATERLFPLSPRPPNTQKRLSRQACPPRPLYPGPLRLATRFPFGLFCHTVTIGGREPLSSFLAWGG